MFKVLNQPYPVNDNVWQQLRKAAAIGLFIGLFLAVFQPFGLSTWETPNRMLKILGFGLVTFVITAFNFTIWQRLFPKQFADERWTVGREILLVTGNILIIAIGNRLYLEWLLGADDDTGFGWLAMIAVTFLIGLFPVTGLVMLSYISQLKKYSQAAAELSVHSTAPSISVEHSVPRENEHRDFPLTLIADNEKDTLTLASTDLLFIESSDNYCTVVHVKNGSTGSNQPVKSLLRSSLSRLESQINVPHIVRCHRSNVVNLNRVERVTGNAQGYKLHLHGGQFQIPVARRYNDTLVAELKAL